MLKGESLQQFVNEAVGHRPLEALKKPFGAVATDLHSGDSIVFRTGNTGMAVRASATVPGVFQPVKVSGREYVDGGLSSLIPVRSARQMGANVVIATPNKVGSAVSGLTAIGDYVFRVTARDGVNTTFKDLSVKVYPPGPTLIIKRF